MKRLIAVTLAFILVFALTACGGTAPTEPADATTASDTTAAVSDETTADEPIEMNHYVYEHVVVVGVDGAGQYIRDAETPTFDRIFENGAVTYGAYANYPTNSGENWGSILTGVKPSLHGWNNTTILNDRDDIVFPSIFKLIRDAYPEAPIGAYCAWGYVAGNVAEDDIDVMKESMGDVFLTPRVCSLIEETKPTFLFVHFEEVDTTGHARGYGSESHLKEIKTTDRYIEQVYQSICNAGIADTTLFVVVADHGGMNNGDGQSADHGGWSDGEKYITLAVAGKTVKAGEIEYANNRDVAAIVLYALGIEAPEFDVNGWTSQVPDNVFDENDVPTYDRSIYAEDGRDAE